MDGVVCASLFSHPLSDRRSCGDSSDSSSSRGGQQHDILLVVAADSGAKWQVSPRKSSPALLWPTFFFDDEAPDRGEARRAGHNVPRSTRHADGPAELASAN